jgi:hypothetical protein
MLPGATRPNVGQYGTTHRIQSAKTYLSNVPVGQLFVKQLPFVLLSLLANAHPAAGDTSRLVPGEALFDKTLNNILVAVTLLLHVDNQLVFFIKINSDGFERSSMATLDRGTHLVSLVALGGQDYVGSRTFL